MNKMQRRRRRGSRLKDGYPKARSARILLPRLLLAVATIAAASCSSASGDDGLQSASTSQTADAGAGAELEISGVVSPDNSLIANVSVTAETSAPVTLDIDASGVETRQLTSPPGTNHDFTVVGLRADTPYEFTASSGEFSAVTSLTTGPLPEGLPEVAVEVNEPSTASGITFFGLTNSTNQQNEQSTAPAYVGVDPDGHIVWYLETTKRVNGSPVIRNLGNGEILAFFADSVDRMSLDGRLLQSYDLSGAGRWKHDAVPLDNGGVLTLVGDLQTIDGSEILGDTIVELDASGSVVWEWSSFDHLDTTRFPGALSTNEARAGGIDWTHGNAVYYDQSTDQILLSLRSQGWIVNIDHATGEIVWIAGEDTGTDAGFDASFLELTEGTWTTGQHAATWTDDGELLAYDNRNESGGDEDNSRIVTYAIDGESETAAQTFEYIAPKYTSSLGDVDELENGNLFLTAGGRGSSDTAHLVEVDRSGATIWEATVDGAIYRSERLAWSDVVVNNSGDASGDSDGGDPDDGDPEDPDPETSGPPGDSVDITGAVLTSTDADCAAYVGNYSSMISDVSNGTEFEGQLTITADDDHCTLISNQIPNHDIGIDASGANDADEVDATFRVPTEPVVNAEPTGLGSNGHAVMLNGVIWELFPAACFDEGPSELGQESIGCNSTLDHPWRYNIGSPLNGFRLDAFSAHSQATGVYHYHATPEALYEIECNDVSESPVIGFARDGFPVYGPCFTDEGGTIRAAESSYVLQEGPRQDVAGFTTPHVVGNVQSDDYNGQFMGDYEFTDGAGDLDECNGMVVDGQYGYYITGEYPYVMACFSGTPSDEFGPTGEQSGRESSSTSPTDEPDPSEENQVGRERRGQNGQNGQNRRDQNPSQ